MAGPDEMTIITPEAEGIVAAVLYGMNECAPGEPIRGDPSKKVYEILCTQREDPLVRDHIIFLDLYGYSKTIDSVLSKCLLGGSIVNYTNNSFKVRNPTFLSRIGTEYLGADQFEAFSERVQQAAVSM